MSSHLRLAFIIILTVCSHTAIKAFSRYSQGILKPYIFKHSGANTSTASILLDSIQSINQWGHTSGGASPRQPYDAKTGGPFGLVSMQAPFPTQVSLHMIYRLTQAMNSMDIPLASSTRGCLLQKQPGGQGQLQGSAPRAHIA